MADYEGVDTYDFATEIFDNFGSTPVKLQQRENWQVVETARTSTAAAAVQSIFRGVLGGNYVYNTGSPPVGATDVVVIGTTES